MIFLWQEKISQLESHHAGALEQLKSNVQLVENVLLEKVNCGVTKTHVLLICFDVVTTPSLPPQSQDQAIIRVKQLEEEIQMLKHSLEDLVREAGDKTKLEVEEIR